MYNIHFSIIFLIFSSSSISSFLTVWFDLSSKWDCHKNRKSLPRIRERFLRLLHFFILKFYRSLWCRDGLRHEEELDNSKCYNPIDKHSKQCCPLEDTSLDLQYIEYPFKRSYKYITQSIDKSCESGRIIGLK